MPMQPVAKDADGNPRFLENRLVRHLLDVSTSKGFGLNQLALVEASPDERAQFAELIGYSLQGYAELSYVSDERVEAANAMAENPGANADRLMAQRALDRLRVFRESIREPIAALFGVHLDDLKGEG
jgi:hypothetical protein